MHCASGWAQQQYNYIHYGVNEGLLQTTIIDMEVDDMNFIWLSYPNGIQRFDGRHFTSIGVQPGLPDNKWSKIFSDNQGNLFISHNKGVSVYSSVTNAFRYVAGFESGTAKFNDFIGIYKNVLYWLYDDVITGYDLGQNKIVFNRSLPVIARTQIKIKALNKLNEGLLWVGGEGVHYIYNLENGHFRKIEMPSANDLMDVSMTDNNTCLLYTSPSPRD